MCGSIVNKNLLPLRLIKIILMWINKEPFLSHENHAFTAGQQISDARYFLLHPEDQMHFQKIKYATEFVSPVEHDSNPATGLTGEVLPQ